MICDGHCGQDLPSNFLRPVDIQGRDRVGPTVRTLRVCKDCYHAMKDKGVI